MQKKVLFIGISLTILVFTSIIIHRLCSPEWTELSCGLWINKNEDIGFRTSAAIDEGEYVDAYITDTDFGYGTPLNFLVDTATFHHMGGSFYKDKTHIYNYMPMSDGGTIYLMDSRVDYSTFEVLEDGCYARDKKHVYNRNLASIVDNVDYETFRVIKGCIAQDRNGFFMWGERITENDAKEYLEMSDKIKGFK